MVKSIKEELRDLNDWKEILGERLKERLSGEMSNVLLLALLLVLFFVVLLGGFVISSSENVYSPIIGKILPASQPTQAPVILATAVPTLTPTLKPVPTEQVSPTTNVTPTNSTTPTPTPTSTPVPTMGGQYGTGSGSPPPNPPVASFTCPTSAIAGDSVSFHDTSTGWINSREWDFDNDGSIDSSAQDPTFTYSSAGTYTVKLTVTNGGGSDTHTNSVTVTMPVVSISGPTGAVTGNEVSFTSTSTGTPVSWLWTFGDGGTSTEKDPKHTYLTEFLYVVNLVVTYAGDITINDSHTIDITNST